MTAMSVTYSHNIAHIISKKIIMSMSVFGIPINMSSRYSPEEYTFFLRSIFDKAWKVNSRGIVGDERRRKFLGRT